MIYIGEVASSYLWISIYFLLNFKSPTKGWGAYLTYQNRPSWTPGSFSIPQSLPFRGCGLHTLLPTLNSPVRGLGCPYSRDTSRYNPDILVTILFSTFSFLDAASDSSFPICLPLHVCEQGPAQYCYMHSGFSQTSLLVRIPIINFLLHGI